MASADTGPLIPRRRLGAAFRELREARGETLQQTAKALMFSPSKLSRIENGGAGEPHPRDVRDLIAHFAVDDGTADRLQELAEAGRRAGWWQLPPYEFTESDLLDTYISYESAAARIREYSPVYIPGLLQTPRYAGAVISPFLRDAAPGELERQVDGRLERQRRLRRNEPPVPRLHVVTETVLHLRVGSPEIMAEQLGHLLDAATEPSVELHVIPFDAGPYEGFDMTNLVIFEFDPLVNNTIVAFERANFIEFLERDATVTKYSGIFERLSNHWLDAPRSRKLIEARMREWQKK